MNAGFRPRATSPFCFGKRGENHFRPGPSLRVPCAKGEHSGAAELAALRQSSLCFRMFHLGSAVPEG